MQNGWEQASKLKILVLDHHMPLQPIRPKSHYLALASITQLVQLQDVIELKLI